MPKWLFFSVLTVITWGVWGVLSKNLGDGWSAVRIQALSTLGIIPTMFLVTLLPNWRSGPRQRRGSLHAFGAGAVAGVGNMAYYQAIAFGAQATTAASLTSLYPVATIILAVIFLKERLRAWHLAGIVGALVAIALFNVSKPDEIVSPWLGFALAPIVFWGWAGFLTKTSTHHASAALAAFWFLAAFVPLGVILLFVEPINWSLSAGEWVTVVALGATYALGNFTVLIAYASGGKASIVTTFCGLYPLVTIVLAMVFFDERIGTRQLLGIILALSSAAALSYNPGEPGIIKRGRAVAVGPGE